MTQQSSFSAACEVANLTFAGVDPEGQAPVACDVKAPCAFAVTGHLMRFPERDRAQFIGVLHVLKERQHLTELVHRVGRNTFLVIFVIKAFQSFMHNVPYPHRESVTLHITQVNIVF